MFAEVIEIGPNLSTFLGSLVAALVPVLVMAVGGWVAYKRLQATADHTQRLVNGAAATLADKAEADRVRLVAQDKEIAELHATLKGSRAADSNRLAAVAATAEEIKQVVIMAPAAAAAAAAAAKTNGL